MLLYRIYASLHSKSADMVKKKILVFIIWKFLVLYWYCIVLQNQWSIIVLVLYCLKGRKEN
jgi:hypothetical protein